MTIAKKIVSSSEGQATVELAVMFPIVLIIAFICVNALTFFSQCCAFDRDFKQIVACIGPSPSYGENIFNVKSIVEEKLKSKFDKDFIDVSVSVENVSGGFFEFDGEIKMHPTLFGMGLRSEFFGVDVPSLKHMQKITIDSYKPGVIF